MPVAVDPKEEITYILEAERTKETPTRFFLKAPSSSKQNRMKAKFFHLLNQHNVNPIDYKGREDEMPYALAVDYGLVVLEEVLVGWDDFFDAQGRKVPFKTVNLRANIDRLEPDDQEELAAAAQKLTQVTGDEAKNSDGLSSSEDSPKTTSAETAVKAGTTAVQKTKAPSPSGQ